MSHLWWCQAWAPAPADICRWGYPGCWLCRWCRGRRGWGYTGLASLYSAVGSRHNHTRSQGQWRTQAHTLETFIMKKNFRELWVKRWMMLIKASKMMMALWKVTSIIGREIDAACCIKRKLSSKLLNTSNLFVIAMCHFGQASPYEAK